MLGGRLQAVIDWRLAISARNIVAIGAFCLAMVLAGTLAVGGGRAFIGVMATTVLVVVVILLIIHRQMLGIES